MCHALPQCGHLVLDNMRLKLTTRVVLALLVLAMSSPALPATAAHPDTNVEWEFHPLLPLGYEAVQLLPAKDAVVLFASAQATQWDGWRRVRQTGGKQVLDRDGAPVAVFPRTLDFRVTASARGVRAPLLESVSPFQSSAPLNDFLLGLHFRLLVHRGLDVTQIAPVTVKGLGVPDDVPYDERIYRVSFELPSIPLSDRLVLEVLAPDGTRVCKFHLEFL